MTSELYEPLIERDRDAFPAVARAFLETHSAEELWVAVTRFAVLAYAPSQHAKRAVMACLAAHELRDELGERWVEMIVECALYAAESRQPWSEPPILDPPEPSSGDVEELRAAMHSGDRLRAERWLSARIDDAEGVLRDLVHCDALLMLDTAVGLMPLLGEKGWFALLRMPVWEMVAGMGECEKVEFDPKGSPDAVTAVFYGNAGVPPADAAASSPPLSPYRLARDYAQTLIAHFYARRLPPEQAAQLIRAVHYNLEHGESFADWSFA